jgi:hypothetical protein
MTIKNSMTIEHSMTSEHSRMTPGVQIASSTDKQAIQDCKHM